MAETLSPGFAQGFLTPEPQVNRTENSATGVSEQFSAGFGQQTPAAADTSSVSPEEIARAKKVGDFKVRPLASLVEDKTFDPVSAYDAPEIQDDDDLKKKVLEVFKARQSEGFNAGKFAGGFVKGLASLPGAISKGVGTVAGELSNVGEGIVNGNKGRVISALSDLGAGVETNAAGLVSNIERAGDKVLTKKPVTDKEWEYQLRKEQNRRSLVKEASTGELGGLDVTAKNSGGEINPEAVEAASTVLDPTLLIPALAGSRAARLPAAVAEAADAGRAAQIADKVLEVGKNATATALEKGSAVLDKASQGLKGVIGPTLGGLAESAAGVAGVPAAGIIAGAVAPKLAKTASEAFLQTAGKLRGTIPPGPIWEAVSNTAQSQVGKGAIKGGVAALGLSGDPLAGAFTALGLLGSENSEQAGQFLGGQAGFGSIAGAGTAGVHVLAPYFDIAGQVFKPSDSAKPIISKPYGTSPELDAVNDRAIQTLTPEIQNRINQFREAVRGRNSEIYVVDPENFSGAVTDMYRQAAEQAGKPLTPDQLETVRDSASGDAAAKGLFVDNFDFGNGQKKKVIFLNSDGGALQHEGGHLMLSMLDPQEYGALRTSVENRYTPEELSKFKDDYEQRLGQKISHSDLIDEVLAENVSAVLNSVPVEQLGTPKPVARAIYQAVGGLLDRFGIAGDRKTALGLRPDVGVGKQAENLLRAQESEANPQIQSAAKIDLTKVDLKPKETAGKPPGVPPIARRVTGTSGESPENIRVSREDQNRFQRSASDESLAKAAKAVDSNQAYGPQQKAAFVKVGAVIAQGGDRPRPIEVEYSAAKSREFQAGRDTRRTEQSDTYVKEATGALPEHVRQLTQKVLIPDRFEVRSGDNVLLLGKSLDKIVANAYILAKDAHKNGVENLVPYDNKGGALTNNGWQSLVEDIQHYTANQSNGYAGDGSSVRQPAGYKGVIPSPNPNFKPIAINKNSADFVNMIMALPPPKTGRKGVTASGSDANAIARTLAVENGKIPLESITSRDPQKKFLERNKVDIAEFNPLRDQMARAGVKIRDLIETTERINLEHLREVKVRNDLDFSRPSTDLIRAGFMPDPKRAPRIGNEEVRNVADDYSKAAGVSYKPFTGYEKLSPDAATHIADWYDSVTSAPEDPAVRESYHALAEQTKAQYDAIERAGYTIEPWEGKGEPYQSSADMVNDVKKNKHLWFLPTEGNFGSGKEGVTPMLEPSGVTIDGRELVVNDLFRAVHDFFGHAKEGYEFGPRGEYNAFLAHSRMFTPEAVPALAAETLAQNAWVNNGAHLRRADGSLPVKGDADFVPPQNRPFAEQKAVIVPPELLSEALKEPTVQYTIQRAQPHPADASKTIPGYVQIEKQTNNGRGEPLTAEERAQFPEPHESIPTGQYTKDQIMALNSKAGKFMPGGEKLDGAIGGKQLRIVHLSGAQGLTKLTTKNFGKGMATPVDLRGSPKIFFFEENSPLGADRELFKGRNAYGATVSGDRIYDANKDPLDWQGQINREKADESLKTAGYDGLRIETNDGRKVVALFKDTKVTPLGQFEIGSRVKIPTGRFMPGDVYIGEVNADGDVKSVRSDNTGAHSKLGMGKDTRWRYVPELQKLFWWDSQRPTESQRESVASHLEKKGFKIKSSAVLNMDDVNNFERDFKQAHGASAEEVAKISNEKVDIGSILRSFDSARR